MNLNNFNPKFFLLSFAACDVSDSGMNRTSGNDNRYIDMGHSNIIFAQN